MLGTIARAFWYFSATRNIKFKFQHAPGESMDVADALSRAHIDERHAQRVRDIVRDNALHYVNVQDHHCDFRSYV